MFRKSALGHTLLGSSSFGVFFLPTSAWIFKNLEYQANFPANVCIWDKAVPCFKQSDPVKDGRSVGLDDLKGSFPAYTGKHFCRTLGNSGEKESTQQLARYPGKPVPVFVHLHGKEMLPHVTSPGAALCHSHVYYCCREEINTSLSTFL